MHRLALKPMDFHIMRAPASNERTQPRVSNAVDVQRLRARQSRIAAAAAGRVAMASRQIFVLAVRACDELRAASIGGIPGGDA